MAMILDAFGGLLADKLVTVLKEQAIMILGVKDELQKLQTRMKTTSLYLKNAEERRINDPAVNGWVTDLKAFMYDAYDVIDFCMIEGTKLLEDDDHLADSTCSAVRCSFSFFSCVHSVPFRHEIANRVKSLNDTLDQILSEKNKFKFEESASNSFQATRRDRGHQSSPLPELDIVGWNIRDDSQELVNLLVSEDEQKCSVFAITGMGGIGKTTLAQVIYNESKIKEGFMQHSWSFVSRDYSSDTDILKGILSNIGKHCEDADATSADLIPMLKDALSGKTFFLVLDDLWKEDVWVNLLRNPVESGAAKIRILITTRDKNVAEKMGAVHIHNVSKLSVDDGWELLCKKIFRNKDAAEMQRLRDVGMKIVEKCDRLPLAIKTVAGVLNTKHRKEEWEKVLNSNTWTRSGLPEKIQAALYLSYEDLPSEIKPCFHHCALRPPGRVLYRENLVREWIAEGFVTAEANASLEDIAEDYYMELLRRSFLHPDPTYVDHSQCTMHDLLRSLALFLAQEESFFGDPKEVKTTAEMRLRRLSISSKEETVSLPNDIIKKNCLRTLMVLKAPPQSLETDIIGKLSHLRVLILNVVKVERVPKNIGDLVLLRLLDLSHTQISELPDSLGNLSNLQFLNIEYCKSLHSLPKSITKLCNLRCLGVDHTPLSHLPKGIGKLKHLNDLRGFLVGNDNYEEGQQEGCSLEELDPLDNLRYLVLNKLERTITCASVLSNKDQLRQLVLNCTSFDKRAHPHSVQEISRIEQVFDELSPPCLDRLVIRNYFGSRYPKWMSPISISSSLSELTSLHLISCKSWSQLPPLGRLPQLSFLKIHGASEVVSIGPEFLGSGVQDVNVKPPTAFPKLKHVQIRFMPKWEEWSLSRNDNDESSKLVMTCNLQRLNLHECQRLKALPRGLSQVSIQNLYIGYAHRLNVVKDLPALTDQLSLTSNHGLLSISNLPALKNLVVSDCPMLNCVEKLDSLQSLHVVDSKSSNVPQWLITFLQERQLASPGLSRLHLECNVKALKECLKASSGWSVLQHVLHVVAYAEKKSKYLLYTKEPYSYKTNVEE